jgi:hypothetical protein
MALTVALWLASGFGLATIAWLAAPTSFPAGEASCVIAGVGGAFVGGELFVVLSGPVHDHPAVLTLLGSIAGGLLCLDLITHAASPHAPLPDTRLSRTWLSLLLWSPVIVAVAIGAALAQANSSALIGLAAAVTVALFVGYWHQCCRPHPKSR